ncbi:hypothetical protein AMAG_11878 [Allomyces macrogynus ATCC 38327]|uniref:Uncharacterized protein n=1 Tax=Allomyces macrogynus (strain ATCC 38327) TaxID=578462 RepID=A0A0L0SYI8_ALLM3|nr:hypothetical protein AMAG_11878 [Allomyces macrogynus ATCC 38327]|eukprot:KNE67414.1 hypothetical protein AMAG_11878 [Allomyces macrogynus ATCC 38327]
MHFALAIALTLLLVATQPALVLGNTFQYRIARNGLARTMRRMPPGHMTSIHAGERLAQLSVPVVPSTELAVHPDRDPTARAAWLYVGELEGQIPDEAELRVSVPASVPVNVDVEVFTMAHHHDGAGAAKDRINCAFPCVKYLRVRAVWATVTRAVGDEPAPQIPENVDVALVYEPVVLGVPETAQSLVPLVLGAVALATFILYPALRCLLDAVARMDEKPSALSGDPLARSERAMAPRTGSPEWPSSPMRQGSPVRQASTVRGPNKKRD